MKRNLVYLFILTSLFLLIPYHVVKYTCLLLWAYIRCWFYLDMYYLDAFYVREINMYEDKRQALSDLNHLF